MFSRRSFLQAAGLAGTRAFLAPVPGFAQQQVPSHTDEMTVNTAQRQPVFPRYDFGPVPATLPQEILALGGRHSLRAHAERRDLVAGAAVVVAWSRSEAGADLGRERPDDLAE